MFQEYDNAEQSVILQQSAKGEIAPTLRLLMLLEQCLPVWKAEPLVQTVLWMVPH